MPQRVGAAVRTALPDRRSRTHYLWALFAAGGATAAMVAARDWLDVVDVALLYLILCLVSGVAAGSGPAAVVAFVSFLAFNFFFIPPYYTFAVAERHNELTLIAFLVTALVTGQLVARLRERTTAAVREQERISLLAELNASLVHDVDLDAVLGAIVERVVTVYGAASCRILLPEPPDGIRVAARFPATAPIEIDPADCATVRRVISRREPVARRAGEREAVARLTGDGPAPPPTEPSDVLYLPIATADRTIGALEVVGPRDGRSFDSEDQRLVTTFVDQAALALERVRLFEEEARSAVLTRSDELKSALLAAVSHDLRTPLATIKASATSLLDPEVSWTDEARAEFLHAIDEETDRLALLVDNLLDLSKIEGGVLRSERAWYDTSELVADVAARLSAVATAHRLTADVAPDLPLVRFDYVQIRQVLLNLGENAVKYTPPDTAIALAARRVPGAIELSVTDRGPGIDARALPHIFDTFYRAEPSGRVPGSGIGLAISKGLVEANGGRIWAESWPGAGTAVRFTLPLEPDVERSA